MRYLRYTQREDLINRMIMDDEDYEKTKESLYIKENFQSTGKLDDRKFDQGSQIDMTNSFSQAIRKSTGNWNFV